MRKHPFDILILTMMMVGFFCSAHATTPNTLQGHTHVSAPSGDDFIYIQGATHDVRALDPTYYLPVATAASTYLTQSAATATYLAQSTAASTYLTQSNAASTYQPLNSANLTKLAALAGTDVLYYRDSAGNWSPVSFSGASFVSGTLTVSGGGGSGSVTSVNASGGSTGFGFTGGPITGTGTLTLTISNAATARTGLGLAIGTNVEAWSANLDAFSAKIAPTGTILGTTDTQTISGKSIDASQLTGSIASGRYAGNSIPFASLNIVGGTSSNYVHGDGSLGVPSGTLPTQTGNAGKYLTTDGTNSSWGSVTASIGQSLENVTTFSSTGQSDVNRSAGSNLHTSFLIAGAGSGSYTRTISLLKGNTPVLGNQIRTVINLPASTNPTIVIHDGAPGGTILVTVTNPSAVASQTVADFVYDGTNWILISSTFVPSTSGGSGDMLKANYDSTNTGNKVDHAILADTVTNGVTTSRTVTGANSVTGGGDLSANRTLALVNDSATPGNTKYYGTDGSGTKGWFTLSAGGTVALSSITQSGASTGQVVTWNGSAWTPVSPTVSVAISSNVTYYASTSGSDSNDGLSSGAPKTLQGTLDFFEGKTINSGVVVTIQCADGAYTATEGFFCKSFHGGGRIYIKGNSSDPTAVSLASTDVNSRGSLTVGPTSPCEYKAGYMTILGVAQYTAALLVTNSGTMYLGDKLRFTAYTQPFANGQIFVEMPTAKLFMDTTAGLIIAGAANTFIYLKGGAYADLFNNGATPTIDCAGSARDFTSFIKVEQVASMIYNGFSVSNGSITGPKYDVSKNAVLNNITGSAVVGSSAGSTSTGGQYIGP